MARKRLEDVECLAHVNKHIVQWNVSFSHFFPVSKHQITELDSNYPTEFINFMSPFPLLHQYFADVTRNEIVFVDF